MIRKVINIDDEKCIGCGACANACHQGAIAMVNGKAKLVKEDHCDGLGVCLPKCPVDAISMIEKEFDEPIKTPAPAGCPSNAAKTFKKESVEFEGEVPSRLEQWPVQIKLLNPMSEFFNGADLLVAADCCGFSYGNFHNDFMKDKVTIIGCPKLDDIDYSEKLSEIIKYNDIKSITVVRMNVPCCGGLTYAVNEAIKKSGKNIEPDVTIITTEGQIQ